MTIEQTYISEPARQTPVLKITDIVVLGGGPAGMAATVAAANEGKSVLLVERYGFLGGLGTAGGVSNFCGLYSNGKNDFRRIVTGTGETFTNLLADLDGIKAPHIMFGDKVMAQAFDISAFKLAADKLLTDAGVELLFHSEAVAATLADDETIESLILETRSGRLAVKGKTYIDCSGDGSLAALAGCRFDSSEMLYPSMLYRINNVDAQKAGEIWKQIPRLMAEAEATGSFKFPRKGAVIRPQNNAMEWRVNMTQVADEKGEPVNGIDVQSLSYGEVAGRRQVLETFKFIKTLPGFESAYIIEIPPQLGVRETRRVEGVYTLTEHDVLACVSFDDAIGVNSWPAEVHEEGDVVWKFPTNEEKGHGQLPYRMLITPTKRNLLIAGRCASMTHQAQSSARVMGPCFVMGQAAGTAAALSLEEKGDVRNISIIHLQERLLLAGATLN